VTSAVDPVAIDRASHVPGTERPHPRGLKGIRLGLQEIAQAIERDYKRRPVIAWARRAIHAAKIPDPRGYPNPDRQVAALFAALKSETSFVADPVDTEMMAGTEHLLCLDPHGFCLRAGDCDDLIIAMGSVIATCGIPVQLRLRFYDGQELAHVTLQYDSDPKRGGAWKCIDPSVESGQCSNAPFVREVIQEVHTTGDQEMGTFVSIGQPVDEQDDGSGMMGDVPSAQLPADQAAAWVQVLTQAKASLDGSIANLRARAAGLRAVRADLGYPAADPEPQPSGEAQPTTTPLGTYVQTRQWTASAQAAESKLLATADLVSSALGDGISGKRALYWNAGDLGIAAAPGDPMRVLLATDPNTGNQVPTYFDPVTNAPTGQMGILPLIIIGAIAIVVTLATAYAIDKITAYLATSHHDDMVQKVADQQQALVDAGKQTPAQAAAFVKAATDLSNSGVPPASPGLSFSWWTLAVAALAGGVAVFFAPKIINAAAGALTKGAGHLSRRAPHLVPA
jgi:hypothetical protein